MKFKVGDIVRFRYNVTFSEPGVIKKVIIIDDWPENKYEIHWDDQKDVSEAIYFDRDLIKETDGNDVLKGML